MKIYLDGCDGAGKSTLADYLCKKFKIDKFCLTKDSEKSVNRYLQISDYDDIVCDRTFLSEAIYPTIFGRERWMSNGTVEGLIDVYKRKGVIAICTAPVEVIKQRISNRGKEFKEIVDNLESINNEYVKIANKYKILLVDTSIESFEKISDYIERELKNGKF